MRHWPTLFSSDFSYPCLEEFSKKSVTHSFVTVVVKDKDDPKFDQAKQDKIEKLVKLGTYKFVPECEIKQTGTIPQSRFVLSIKDYGEE